MKNKLVGCLKGYVSRIDRLMTQLDYKAIGEVITCFREARERSSIIFFAGNGGSAATASHFSQDLMAVGEKTGKRGFRAISLADNLPTITALANDHGYDGIFVGQMRELFKKRDVLVAISASGNSPNVVTAAEYAKRSGGVTICLVGFDGGKLAKICDHCVHVRTRQGEYGPVEDIHMILDHMITTYLCKNL